MSATMNWVRLIEPQQLKLGHSGREETPIFADCAGCGAEDAVIAGGIKGSDGHWAIERLPNSLFKQCVYCEACLCARLNAEEGQG